jgi:hypothetical protein
MPAKLDRCVSKVKRKKGKGNPYAICNAAIKGKKKTKKRSKK